MIQTAASSLLLADTWGMHDGDFGTGWMIAMMLFMVVFWGLAAFGIVWLLRDVIGHRRHPGGDDPVAILDRRLAEGELSMKDYEQRKRALGGSSPSAGR